jgi:hypothetical protein
MTRLTVVVASGFAAQRPAKKFLLATRGEGDGHGPFLAGRRLVDGRRWQRELLRPLLDALDPPEDAARALADDLRAQNDDLHARLPEVETPLEHLAITARLSPASPTGSRISAGAARTPGPPSHPRRLRRYRTVR